VGAVLDSLDEVGSPAVRTDSASVVSLDTDVEPVVEVPASTLLPAEVDPELVEVDPSAVEAPETSGDEAVSSSVVCAAPPLDDAVDEPVPDAESVDSVDVDVDFASSALASAGDVTPIMPIPRAAANAPTRPI
jgi:hypothetical protein